MWKFGLSVICFAFPFPLPVPAERPGAKFLDQKIEVCHARLSNGKAYDVSVRWLKAREHDKDLYLDLEAYYMPRSGEFLWRETGYSEQAYATIIREQPNRSKSLCDDSSRHIVLLQDSEWADFWALDDRVTVFHSNLRFPTIEKAWQYVSEHWEEGRWDMFRSTRWCTWISLHEKLGEDFFRPESLRSDARPFSYNSLLSARKVGSNWQLGIKGADEPNRALVVLDGNFKLLRVTRSNPK